MPLTNQANHYGWISIGLHWLLALSLFALFGLGLWMVTLDYYSSWYNQAPWIHKSVGLIVVTLMMLRWVWNRVSKVPTQFEGIRSSVMQILIHASHQFMYFVVLVMGLSGYLISTAKGKPIEVFDWFAVPALPWQFSDQADIAGLVHEWTAYFFMAFVALHALAALKHHFMDRDKTLRRMLKSTT